MGIKTKAILFVSIIIILISATIATYSVISAKKMVIEGAQKKLHSDLALGREYIDEKIPGEWSVRNDKMYKGETLINGNHALMEEIGEITGNTVTVNQGNIRVATNVKNADGTSAEGTPVADNVAQTVLKEGKMFSGEAEVAGALNQTAYEPIKNGSGEIIGIWYTGIPNAPYDEIAASFRNKLILFTVIGLLIVILITWFVVSRYIRPLQEVTNTANQLADGNLQVAELSIRSRDEIGQLSQSVNRMVVNLKELITQVMETTQQVASSSEELSASAEQTTEATNQIAQSIQEVAVGAEKQAEETEKSETAMEEMASGIERIVQASSVVMNTSTETTTEAQQGNALIGESVRQMNSIGKSVEELATVVKQLGERSQAIGEILSVISEIAAQTNLLALNAAIEAARAGEHGRGFAVVADEVRKLAEQSEKSASQIAVLIKEIQVNTSEAVKAMEVSTEEVSSGVTMVNNAGEAFQRIVQATEDVAEQIKNVSTISQQMSKQSHQMGSFIQEISNISKQSAANAQNVASSSEEQLASMEEITASADSLSKLAMELQEAVGQFRL